jgi:hypothetical protein
VSTVAEDALGVRMAPNLFLRHPDGPQVLARGSTQP